MKKICLAIYKEILLNIILVKCDGLFSMVYILTCYTFSDPNFFESENDVRQRQQQHFAEDAFLYQEREREVNFYNFFEMFIKNTVVHTCVSSDPF